MQEESTMEYRKFANTYVVRMDPGEEILEQVKILSQAEGITLASVQALGAVNDFTVGVFHTEHQGYQSNRFQGCYEIVSLTGTINTMDGGFYCHLHMSAGDEQGRVVGGHLNRAVVSATCEMIITEIPGTDGPGLQRYRGAESLPVLTVSFRTHLRTLHLNGAEPLPLS